MRAHSPRSLKAWGWRVAGGAFTGPSSEGRGVEVEGGTTTARGTCLFTPLDGSICIRCARGKGVRSPHARREVEARAPRFIDQQPISQRLDVQVTPWKTTISESKNIYSIGKILVKGMGWPLGKAHHVSSSSRSKVRDFSVHNMAPFSARPTGRSLLHRLYNTPLHCINIIIEILVQLFARIDPSVDDSTPVSVAMRSLLPPSAASPPSKLIGYPFFEMPLPAPLRTLSGVMASSSPSPSSPSGPSPSSPAAPPSSGAMRRLRRLGQSWNTAGVLQFFRVLGPDRRLLVPHVSVPDIRWVDWRALKEAGFKGCVFDKDNTLTGECNEGSSRRVYVLGGAARLLLLAYVFPFLSYM
jgi:hypothetical protein